MNDVQIITMLHAEIKGVEATMEKNHGEVRHRFGDLDTRLTGSKTRLE